jgi:hypothetical protein
VIARDGARGDGHSALPGHQRIGFAFGCRHPVIPIEKWGTGRAPLRRPQCPNEHKAVKDEPALAVELHLAGHNLGSRIRQRRDCMHEAKIPFKIQFQPSNCLQA